GAWCVCRADLPDAALQRTLDYACGSAGECIPIQPSAACFAPDNVKAHCSYAVNSFYYSKYPATATPRGTFPFALPPPLPCGGATKRERGRFPLLSASPFTWGQTAKREPALFICFLLYPAFLTIIRIYIYI
ncbi:hypothetical protein ZWY2020_052153, partial [Hordeum vulgare]